MLKSQWERFMAPNGSSMIIKKSPTYRDYVDRQTEKNVLKLDKVFITEKEVLFIQKRLLGKLPERPRIICHGVRNGTEVKLFRKHLNAHVIGTEISYTAERFPGVIRWDFHDVKPGWIGKVDLIYSNSLDHSYDPETCLKKWMTCLAPGGVCVVCWTMSHGRGEADGADCFRASADEYEAMMKNSYSVLRVPMRDRRDTQLFFLRNHEAAVA